MEKAHSRPLAMALTTEEGPVAASPAAKIPHAEVVALCDDYEPNLRAAQQLCPGAKCYADYRQVLGDLSIDGVIIATPLNWHARMTLRSRTNRQLL